MKKLLLIVVCSCYLSGCTCALTYNKLPLKYTLSDSQEKIYQNKNNQSIAVSVEDKRGMEDPKLIYHKINLAGDTTSGGYLAEEPIANIVQSAINSGLQQMNFKTIDNGKSRYVMNCTIYSIKPKAIFGFWKGTLVIEIRTSNYLYDSKLNSVLWRENIVGRGSVVATFGSDEVLRGAFNNAMTDLVRKIQHSGTFQSAF